jgi:hypothetical protein
MELNIYEGGGYCCKKGLTEEEQLIFSYWTQIFDCLKTATDTAQAKELFGYDSECSFNKINNFHYLLDYLIYIYWYWGKNPTMTREEIYTMFSIDCIIKTFRCLGCNIMKALSVFGLSDSIPIPNPEYVAPIV